MDFDFLYQQHTIPESCLPFTGTITTPRQLSFDELMIFDLNLLEMATRNQAASTKDDTKRIDNNSTLAHWMLYGYLITDTDLQYQLEDEDEPRNISIDFLASEKDITPSPLRHWLFEDVLKPLVAAGTAEKKRRLQLIDGVKTKAQHRGQSDA